MITTPYPITTLSTISITGANTPTFLQGQLTCDIKQLENLGGYSLSACCDHKGRMIANFWVIKQAEDQYLLLLPADMRDILIAHLQKYAVFSKVNLYKNDDFSVLAIDGEPKNNLNKDNELNDILITLPNAQRHLLLTKNKASASNKNDHWLAQNIADKFCLITPKTSLLFIPQTIDLDQQGGVSLTKGCYVGQEIIARTHHLGKLKRHLHRLSISAETPPEPGDPLMNDNQEKTGMIVAAIMQDKKTANVLAVIEDRLLSSLRTQQRE